MPGKGSETKPTLRVRRARRGDIATLRAHAGGPPDGRIRALRRLLKTLSADTYVIDRDGSLDGVVVIAYRRSFAHGGLVATIDALEVTRSDSAGIREDVELLVDCAMHRAKRRGCVAIDASLTLESTRDTLLGRGFAAGEAHLGRTLRVEEKEE